MQRHSRAGFSGGSHQELTTSALLFRAQHLPGLSNVLQIMLQGRGTYVDSNLICLNGQGEATDQGGALPELPAIAINAETLVLFECKSFISACQTSSRNNRDYTRSSPVGLCNAFREAVTCSGPFGVNGIAFLMAFDSVTVSLLKGITSEEGLCDLARVIDLCVLNLRIPEVSSNRAKGAAIVEFVKAYEDARRTMYPQEALRAAVAIEPLWFNTILRIFDADGSCQQMQAKQVVTGQRPPPAESISDEEDEDEDVESAKEPLPLRHPSKRRRKNGSKVDVVEDEEERDNSSDDQGASGRDTKETPKLSQTGVESKIDVEEDEEERDNSSDDQGASGRDTKETPKLSPTAVGSKIDVEEDEEERDNSSDDQGASGRDPKETPKLSQTAVGSKIDVEEDEEERDNSSDDQGASGRDSKETPKLSPTAVESKIDVEEDKDEAEYVESAKEPLPLRHPSKRRRKNGSKIDVEEDEEEQVDSSYDQKNDKEKAQKKREPSSIFKPHLLESEV